MDNSPHGQLAPGTARPMDNSPHGQLAPSKLAPRTTRPMTTRPITNNNKFLIVYYFINTFHWFTLQCTVTQIKHLWHANKAMDNLPQNSSPHKYI
jgi:hypothetical protein